MCVFPILAEAPLASAGGEEHDVIARVWHGWTLREKADLYEHHLRTKIFPEIQHLNGSRGAHLFRRRDGDEIECLTITYFDSLEAVQRFAGSNYSAAVISDEAARLLSRFERQAAHYTVAIDLEGMRS